MIRIQFHAILYTNIGMFENARAYVFVIVCALILSGISWWINSKFITQADIDDYELVKTYLLNDSPLQGKYKPKLWIHSVYDVNARDWKTNQFRNSKTNLAQPYLVLTIQSIINFCGDDFHVCLIDDNSFAKLIPTWDVDMTTISDPMRTYVREIGMLQLLYFYGGMRVPDSFLCLKPLYPLYEACAGPGVYATIFADVTKTPIDLTPDNGAMHLPATEMAAHVTGIGSEKGGDGVIPFIMETANRHSQTVGPNAAFAPSVAMMGSLKHSPVLKEWANHLKEKLKSGHVSEEINFNGELSRACLDYVRAGRALQVNGRFVGTKDNQQQPIGVEKLLSTEYLDVTDADLFGIWIPHEDMLKRTKYCWFSIMSTEEILQSELIIAKYMKLSMVRIADLEYPVV